MSAYQKIAVEFNQEGSRWKDSWQKKVKESQSQTDNETNMIIWIYNKAIAAIFDPQLLQCAMRNVKLVLSVFINKENTPKKWS